MTSYTTGYQNVRGAERRRDRRLPLPIFTVRLDGVNYQTMNWSLGGLLIEGYRGVITAQSIALQFEAMSTEIYEFFERCFADRFKRR